MMLIQRLEPTPEQPKLGIWKYGTGPKAMVAFHGWSGDHSVFEPLLGANSSEYSVYSFDLPGSGISAPPARWTMESLLEPVIHTLDSLGLKEYTLLGNCAGALCALDLALLRPERVQRIVILDPFAYVPWYFGLLTMPWLGPLFYYSSFGNPMGRRLVNGALKEHRAEQTDLTKGFKRVQHSSAYAFLRMLCRLKGLPRYRAISAPVEVIHGAKTFGAVLRSVELLRALWPQRFIAHKLEEAGHLPMQEVPERVSDLVFSPSASGGRRPRSVV